MNLGKFIPEYISPPARIPMNSELYTSFVMSASPIATIGGRTAHIVAYIAGLLSAAIATIGTAAMKSVVSPNTYIILLLLMRIILKPPYK